MKPALVSRNDCAQPRRQNEFNRLSGTVSSHLIQTLSLTTKNSSVPGRHSLTVYPCYQKTFFFLFSRKSSTDINSPSLLCLVAKQSDYACGSRIHNATLLKYITQEENTSLFQTRVGSKSLPGRSEMKQKNRFIFLTYKVEENVSVSI